MTAAPSKRMVTKSVRMPEFIVNQAPLLKSENREDYNRLAESIAASVGPRNWIEWFFVKDVIDALWETRRYRRIKAAVLEIAQREQVEKLLKETLDPKTDPAEAAIEMIVGAKTKAQAWMASGEAKSKIDDHLSMHGYSADEILAGGVISHLKVIEDIDRMLAASETRRNDALRSIEYFSPVFAKRAAEASNEIIEVEFREVKNNAEAAK